MDSTREIYDVCLAFGTNVGDRMSALAAAKAAVSEFIDITALSAVYETKPAYVTDQPLFLNAAVRGKTNFEPRGLLFSVKDAEIEIGRIPTFRYGPRVIDIDIIFFEEQVMSSPELTIPHALMAERSFVLRPLADVALDWQHPVLNKSAQQLLDALPDKDDPEVVAENF